MPTIESPDMGLVSVRAKFIVKKVEYYNESSRLVVLHPVYSQDPNHENKMFWDATPSGELTMTINNPRAAAFFEIGQEYYLDFVHPSKNASHAIQQLAGDGVVVTASSTPVSTVTITSNTP